MTATGPTTLHIESQSGDSLDALAALVENGDSVLVRGDASVALNALGRFSSIARLVLIDPPYNRRTRFHHYNDSTSNDNWLKTIKAHCCDLRDLLSSDGSLWMHIDDASMPTARIMLDSLFGPSNFVAKESAFRLPRP